ncbi:site-2 protease family protein [Streptomyces sp. PSKA28]|uniref:Site-2 protease family protein n=1 Tax=Streptomyces himalayensis subsp. himalayensis TaxID=2756131 RepID=A0A7W0I8L3_9ACTN|nr:site-2 protease family protein [Streptomyces himalayensis subsp. himalayensis]
MDESGGRGQPRSGNSGADQRRIAPSRPDGADAPPERPASPVGTGQDAQLADGDHTPLAHQERPDTNASNTAEPDAHTKPTQPSGPGASAPPGPSAPSRPAAPTDPSAASGPERPEGQAARGDLAERAGQDAALQRSSGGSQDRPADASATQPWGAAEHGGTTGPSADGSAGSSDGGVAGSSAGGSTAGPWAGKSSGGTAVEREAGAGGPDGSRPGRAAGPSAAGAAGSSAGSSAAGPWAGGSGGPSRGTPVDRDAGTGGSDGSRSGASAGSPDGGSAGSPAGGSAGRPGQGPPTGPGPGGPGKPPRGPGGGLLMGRPFGVPVYVAPSWFLVAALITWVFGGQIDRVLPELGAVRYLVSLFFAVAFYASVLVHELAHTVAALRFKLPVRRIQLQFFGGVSEIEKESETPGREFVLAFVGPLLSLVLAGVFYAGLQAVEPGTVPGVLLAGLMISNLIVAAFNLLPGLPLDGGRMLRAVVWKITGKPMSGTIAAAWVGRALAISVLVGLPLLTQSGALGSGAEEISGMDTVTDALLAAILAAIIWTGAGNSLRMARLREHLPELRARALTRRAVPVASDTPLSEALRRANESGARALVVVDAHGDPLSVVREAAIVGVPEHRRPWVAVSSLAQDLTDGMRVSAELAGEELLDVLRATPATEYLVVEDTGEIYGVLSAADVERAFVKAMARPAS